MSMVKIRVSILSDMKLRVRKCVSCERAISGRIDVLDGEIGSKTVEKLD